MISPSSAEAAVAPGPVRAPGRLTPAEQVRLAFRLARRLARSRALVRSVGIVFVAALLVMGMFVTLRTLSLSGEQVADRDLGRFGAKVGYGSGVALPPGDDTFAADLAARVRDAGVTGAEILLSATDVQLNTTPARNVTALEADWATRPYPERYELLSGRWPSRPGEVVVTEPQDVKVGAGRTLTVLGDVRLEVVGTADDRHATTTNLLFGPGTWAGLDADLSEGFPVLTAQPDLMWSGERQQAVLDAFTTAARTWTQEHGGATAEDIDRDSVAATFDTREELSAAPQKTWIEKTPAGYTVPSLLVPAAAVLLVFGLNDRRFRRTTASLVSVGVPRRAAVAGPVLAALAWSLAAAFCGALAGVAAGAGARMLISYLSQRPAGPLDDLATPALRLLAVVVLTGLVTGAALARIRREAAARPHIGDQAPSVTASPSSRFSRLARDARHLLAVAAWCAVVVYSTRVDSPPQAMVLTGILIAAVLLIVPGVFDRVLRVLPEGGPRRRLMRRQLAADARRACAALMVLTVLFGASLGYLTLLDTLIRTAEKQAYPPVLSGQVLLASHESDTFPPSEALLRTVDESGAVDGLPRTEVRYLMTGDVDDLQITSRESSHGTLLAADTPRQVERLLGRRLDRAQATVLRHGGLLVWSDAPDSTSARTRLVVREGDTVLHRTAELPTATVAPAPAGWRDGSDGIMLRSTAQALELPIQPHGPVMVTGISADRAHALQQSVIDAGMDAGAVLIYVKPDDPVPPAALLATAAGLVILALAAVLAATRSQTRILRRYLARLVAIGIPPRWTRHVLLCQHGVLIAMSTLLGLVIAVVPSVVLAAQVSGFALSVPWWQLGVLAAALYLAALLAALHSAHKLRVTEARSG